MYIYSKRCNPTAKLLAEILDCTYGRRRLRRNKRWDREKLIVSWGLNFNYECNNILNKKIHNKLYAFYLLRDSVLSNNIPFFTEYIADISSQYYPIVGRKYRHTQGEDIKFLNYEDEDTESDFYVQYIPKIAEFRVHVFKDQILRIDKKVKIEGREYTEEEIRVRCSNNGWRQIRYTINGRYYSELAEIGIKAVKALNYDFGAVDIIINRERKPIILEINSAPALRGEKLELYANAFKHYEETL